MSHYLTVAIMPDGVTSYAEARGVVQQILEPHCEMDGDNEDGVWDWYQVGGRWTGFYSEYDPEDDPRNVDNATGYNAERTGRKIKWPTQWKEFEGDLIPVSYILNIRKFPVYVFLPDGRRVGHWDDEREENQQAVEVALLDAKDKLALVVDIHS